MSPARSLRERSFAAFLRARCPSTFGHIARRSLWPRHTHCIRIAAARIRFCSRMKPNRERTRGSTLLWRASAAPSSAQRSAFTCRLSFSRVGLGASTTLPPLLTATVERTWGVARSMSSSPICTLVEGSTSGGRRAPARLMETTSTTRMIDSAESVEWSKAASMHTPSSVCSVRKRSSPTERWPPKRSLMRLA